MRALTLLWLSRRLTPSARAELLLDCAASSYAAMFVRPSGNRPSPSPQASSSASSSASPSSPSSPPSPPAATPSKWQRHQCRDCTEFGGIGFDCNHLVRGRLLADECRWCRERGYEYGQELT